MKTIDVIPFLRRVPIFAELDEEALNAVKERTVLRQFPKNGQLFREGQPCEGLFIIIDGSIKVYRSSPEGREQVLHVEGPKRALAELPLFDGGPYPASARAAEDSVILFLPRDAFQWLYRSNPQIADAVISDLAGRLRRLVRLVGKVTLKDVPARVAATLIEEATAAGAARDGGEFEIPATQDDLADALATTRESVARAFARFRNEGIIDQEGAKFRIRDLQRLHDAAGVSIEALGEAVIRRAQKSALRS
jgi:CRP/FNR family transcriptional regulator, cyclic AMP receptor protein